MRKLNLSANPRFHEELLRLQRRIDRLHALERGEYLPQRERARRLYVPALSVSEIGRVRGPFLVDNFLFTQARDEVRRYLGRAPRPLAAFVCEADARRWAAHTPRLRVLSIPLDPGVSP